MEYWKYLELDNVEKIQEKTLTFIREKTDFMDKSKYKGPYINLPFFDYNKDVPELQESFLNYGLYITGIHIFLMWNNTDCIPHKDYTDAIGRVNIPILNCQGSKTIFYKNLKSKRLMLPTRSPFYMTINKDYEEAGGVEIDRPTIVRISEGHTVVMNDKNFPRITLTVSTIPDVGLLLDD